MSPQPFPNIFGGLAEGIQTGQRMGLMANEQKLRKEESEQKQKEFDLKAALQLETRDLGRLESTMKNIKDMPPSGRISVLEALPMQTELGKSIRDTYVGSDDTRIKKISEGQRKLTDALNRRDWTTVDDVYPELMGWLGKDSPAGIALKETAVRVRKQEADSLILREQTLREEIKSGKHQGKAKEQAFAQLKQIQNKIVQFPEALSTFTANITKEYQSKPEYMKYPEEAAGWEAKKAGIQAGKEKDVAQFREGLDKEKPIKPEVALDKIASLKAGIARLQSSGEIDPALAEKFPEIAAFQSMMGGGKKDPKLVQDAVNASNQAISYYQQFTPQGKQGTPATEAISQYKTPEEVKAAFSSGSLPKEEALKILREKFKME